MNYFVNSEISLVSFLMSSITSKSKTKIKNIIKSGRVSVNGEILKKPDFILKPGNNVKIIDKTNIQHKQNRFNILFEDNFILIADKPSGLLSISTDRENKNTFYRFVSDYLKEKSNNKEKIFIVHRLDREVSGIMIFAKNFQIKESLQRNWTSTNKIYYAVVEGVPPEKEGKIESWLKENKSHFVFISSKEDDAYLSVTKYKLISTHKNFSLLEILLETGRKHQIRVQLAEIGCPVAGDLKYGAKTNPVNRICLHSGSLSFTHPVTGKSMVFSSDIPSKMLKLIR
jgi:23S rRNA pseudouridine1911/1915/1917 synthase